MKRSKAQPISQEMDGGGWVKLWRKTLDSEVFADPNLWHLFSWCLLLASHTAHHVRVKTGRGDTVITLGPGQFIYGRKSKSEELGLPESTLSDRMKRLEAMGTITVEADTHYSIITIVNWGLYQGKGGEPRHPNNTQTTPKQRATNTQAAAKQRATDTNKNGEKAKKAQKGENGEKGESSRGDHRSNRGVWGEVSEATGRLAKDVSKTVRVNPDNRTGDRSLILKVCYLVAAGTMPEAWLRDAVEAVKQGKHKKNTAAYFHTCLTEGAMKRHKSLAKLLATACTEIPADVLAGKPADQAADDRLGARPVGDDPAHQGLRPCVPEGLNDPKHVPQGKPAKEHVGGPSGVAG